MRPITITLSDELSSLLNDKAARLGVAPEELVLAGVEEFLTRPDEEFNRAADYVLNKNAELYRRLA